RQALKNCFKASETTALSGTIAEYLATDAAGEDLSNHEGDLVIHTHLIKSVACRVVVCSEHNNAAVPNVILKVDASHEIDSVTLYFQCGVSIQQRVCYCVDLPLPEVATPAHVANNVFR